MICFEPRTEEGPLAYVLWNKENQTSRGLRLILTFVYFRRGNESPFYNRMVINTIGSIIV